MKPLAYYYSPILEFSSFILHHNFSYLVLLLRLLLYINRQLPRSLYSYSRHILLPVPYIFTYCYWDETISLLLLFYPQLPLFKVTLLHLYFLRAVIIKMKPLAYHHSSILNSFFLLFFTRHYYIFSRAVIKMKPLAYHSSIFNFSFSLLIFTHSYPYFWRCY